MSNQNTKLDGNVDIEEGINTSANTCIHDGDVSDNNTKCSNNKKIFSEIYRIEDYQDRRYNQIIKELNNIYNIIDDLKSTMQQILQNINCQSKCSCNSSEYSLTTKCCDTQITYDCSSTNYSECCENSSSKNYSLCLNNNTQTTNSSDSSDSSERSDSSDSSESSDSSDSSDCTIVDSRSKCSFCDSSSDTYDDSSHSRSCSKCSCNNRCNNRRFNR